MGNTELLKFEIEQAYKKYELKRPNSKKMHHSSSKFLPGGNTRTVLFHKPYPFRVESGEGPYLEDVDGNQALNLLGDFTAGLFGHNHAEIRKSIIDAVSRGTNFGAHNTYENRFAQLVCQRFPSIEKVRFTNSGTEATLMSVTAARLFTGRSKVIVFDGAYHGGVFLFRNEVLTNAPYPWIVEQYNDTRSVISSIRDNADDLAAVLVEPMLGSGGCIAAKCDFLEAIQIETKKAGSLLIFDEVMTSRLGAAGMQNSVEIMPDITTLGKWIGGGMSFGAFGGREEVMNQFDPSSEGAISHAGTFNNNVLTMAAGISVLSEVYTAQKATEFSTWGDGIRHELNRIAVEIGTAVSVTGRGTMMYLHPTSACLESFADVDNTNDQLRELLFLDLLDAGFYIGRNGFMGLSLPLLDVDLNGFFSAFRQILVGRKDLINENQT